MPHPYYHRHVFFCVNQRDSGRACCGAHDAAGGRLYAKQRVAAAGRGDRVRVNQSGCLGRCAEGPLLVVYPEAVWYRYADRADLDEIVTQHLLNGKTVERLLI